jgi:hypothetical protein
MTLERNPNISADCESVSGDFFLEKKPLNGFAPRYIYSDFARVTSISFPTGDEVRLTQRRPLAEKFPQRFSMQHCMTFRDWNAAFRGESTFVHALWNPIAAGETQNKRREHNRNIRRRSSYESQI